MFDDGNFAKVRAATKRMNIRATDEQIVLWLEYIYLLKKWNKTYKMTSITEIDEMLNLHLYDSLSISKYIHGSHTVDVGTGGGLPGVVLAILYPSHEFTLIDSIGKKINFLNHVKYTLNINNIWPIQTRVENFNPEHRFDNVVSRAFTSLENFYTLCKHLSKDNGQFLAMKGKIIEDELLKLGNKSIETIALNVPGLDAERHLVKF
jgi:16S rRNA (guanine527-N7)-methyltransferase